MPYLFTPPSVDRPIGTDRLWSHFRYQVGQALLKKDGFYSLSEVVTDEDVEAADVAYLGGHVYRISDAEAADLKAAGYGDWLTLPPVSVGYGMGRYGQGAFGEGDNDPTLTGYGDGIYGDGIYGD